ncbi:lipoprotein [Spiroplasma endosymbiont of Stenodema calcarata]|uniref:lipoprotein n=1 Tax=Spiroplasma endosymbiont of Stenodema calcarata TaxID=3139328 RepID=UPI003CCA7A05
MKKLLTILGAFGLTATAASSNLIACHNPGNNGNQMQKIKDRISNLKNKQMSWLKQHQMLLKKKSCKNLKCCLLL